METARINEMLMIKIGLIREYAMLLEPKDLEQLSSNLQQLETSVNELKDLLAGLPHRRRK